MPEKRIFTPAVIKQMYEEWTDPKLDLDVEKMNGHWVVDVLATLREREKEIEELKENLVLMTIRKDDLACGTITTMGPALAETYARDPKFYGSTYCMCCKMHKAVDEFVWTGTEEKVGS